MSKILKYNRNKIECVFDIGTSKIVCLFFEKKSKQNYEILGWSHKKSNGIFRSRINDINVASNTIKSVLNDVSKKVKDNKENVVSNITDINLLTKKNYSEINIGGINISKKEVRKIYKKSLQNSNLSQKKLIHSIPLKFNIDDNHTVGNPIGIQSNKLGLTTYNIWTNSILYKNLENCFKISNLVLDDVIDSGFASSIPCLNDNEKELGSTCIDIGAGSVKIATFYKNCLEYINHVPLGGNDVTNDIAKGLEISEELAEYIKILHGTLEFSSNEKIKINLANGEEKLITQNLLHGIIKPRYEEIFEIIRDKLQDNLVTRIGVNQIVLTGGASQIIGSKNLSEKIFNRKTRLSSPNVENTYFNKKPEFSTVIGLMKIKNDSNLKKVIKSQSKNSAYNIIEKFDNWVKDSFM